MQNTGAYALHIACSPKNVPNTESYTGTGGVHLPNMLLDSLYSDKSKKQNNKLHLYLDRTLSPRHIQTDTYTCLVPMSMFSIRENVQSGIPKLNAFAVYRNQESDHACV